MAGRGSIGYSLDAGKTWQPPKAPPAGSNGFICVSTDGARWIWSTGGGGGRGGGGGGGAPNMTADHGDTWTPCAGLPAGTRVVADTVNPLKFYGINLYGGTFYMSTDGGAASPAPMNLGGNLQRGGDNRGAQDKIYATPYAEGDLWIAAYSGLFHTTDSGKTFARVNPGVGQICGFGFGKARRADGAGDVYDGDDQRGAGCVPHG